MKRGTEGRGKEPLLTVSLRTTQQVQAFTVTVDSTRALVDISVHADEISVY